MPAEVVSRQAVQKHLADHVDCELPTAGFATSIDQHHLSGQMTTVLAAPSRLQTVGGPCFHKQLQRSCIRLWSAITCENTRTWARKSSGYTVGSAVFSSPEVFSRAGASDAFASSILARALDGRSSSAKPKPSGQTAAFRISPIMPLSAHSGFLQWQSNASKVM